MSAKPPYSSPCPFCGDERIPEHDEEDVKDGAPPIHSLRCQCCGCQGPVAVSEEAARSVWEGRWPRGQSAAWRKFFEEETTQP